jgi:hypothetical protein
MRNLHELEDNVLIDLLAEYTERYTRLFRNFRQSQHHPEYQHCKNTIQYIILELDRRKKPIENKDASVQKDSGQFTAAQ